MVFVRQESKDHGKQNQIEGVVESGKTYVVVEDLISTGGSSLNTINAVREKNGIVENCIAIFNYELEKSGNNFESSNVRLHTLTNFTNLIKTAMAKKYKAPADNDLTSQNIVRHYRRNMTQAAQILNANKVPAILILQPTIHRKKHQSQQEMLLHTYSLWRPTGTKS